jgi:hypothetical protein
VKVKFGSVELCSLWIIKIKSLRISKGTGKKTNGVSSVWEKKSPWIMNWVVDEKSSHFSLGK